MSAEPETATETEYASAPPSVHIHDTDQTSVPTEAGAGTETETKTENTMHDKCKNVIAFHNNLTKFLKSLKGVLPEFLPDIQVAIKYYKSKTRSEYLKETQELLEPHISYISEYDYGIFTDDYQKGPRVLLPTMDFRKIWDLLDGEDFREQPVLQAKTQKTIYNHLQSIYVSVQMAMDQIDVFNKNIEKQKTFLMNMLENLQLDETIKKRIEEMKAEEAKSGGGSSGFAGLGKLADMFGEDNFVFQLAKDVAQELDIGTDDIENPVDAITELFADGGQKLRELILTVGDKIEQKVQSGEIDEDRLKEDAQKMKDKIEGFMGKIPGLEDMINNADMMGQFRDSYTDLEREEQEKFSYVPGLLDKQPDEWDDGDREAFDQYAQFVLDKKGFAPQEEEVGPAPEDMGEVAASGSVPIETEHKSKRKTKKGPKGKGPKGPRGLKGGKRK